MNRLNINYKILSSVYIFTFPLLLFLSLEILNTPADESGYFNISSNIPVIIISCILITLSFMLIYAIIGNLFLAGLVISAITLTLYTVNFYRRILTGFVLIPADLNFVKKINDVTAFAELPFKPRLIISLILVAALDVLMYFASKQVHVSAKVRATIFSTMGTVMVFLFFTNVSREKILPVFSIESLPKEGVNKLYDSSGVLMGFYTVRFAGQDYEPEGYSQSYMKTLTDRILRNSYYTDNSDEVKPNVIIIMSESFTDPTRLPNITYSEDPVPNLHALSRTTTSGYTVVPVFGGLTCNTEYEVLTGNSMAYTEYGDTPYHDIKTYIDTDNERALASMFKKNGYKTVGLHTNTIYFYGRDEIYPKLGFDELIGEEMMPDAARKGANSGQELISDEYFMDKLIETIEETKKPLFLFGITMQNHMPYMPDKYESTVIKAESELLTEEELAYVETYVEGIHDIDRQLGRLHQYVMNSEKPTIVVYFGDHLPTLTQNTGVYNELGYITQREILDLSVEESYKMFTTPYIAFSNYKKLPATWGDVSPYFLGALAADAAGIKKNTYYSFLIQAFDSFQALSNNLYAANGEISSMPPEAESSSIKMFKMFQYDKLFGEDYAGKTMSLIK